MDSSNAAALESQPEASDAEASSDAMALDSKAFWNRSSSLLTLRASEASLDSTELE